MNARKTLFLMGLFGSFFVSGLGAQTNPPIVCRAFSETMQPLFEVSVNLQAPSIPLDVTQLTDLTGSTVFAPLAPGTNFGVGCSKNTNPGNGLSTGDLIAISKHILGLQELGSPYKMIAADANRSGSITTFDILTIRSIILGVAPDFPNNASWRFLPADYTFPNPHNPFQTAFPVPGYTAYTAPVSDPIDFIGIKIGDVNNTASPDNFATFDERDLQTLFFETEDKNVEAGETFIATFVGGAVTEGFQFTLNTGGLDIIEVLPGTGTTADQFAIFRTRHAVTVACETPGKARFAIKLKSNRAGKLSELLRIGSEITHAEAYLPATADREAEMARVALGFSETTSDFELHQNRPNPAAEFTDIAFFLPSDMDATLTVFDNSGRVVYSKSGAYKKGDQTVRIELDQIASGVLYYQLQAGSHCAIRKMLRS